MTPAALTAPLATAAGRHGLPGPRSPCRTSRTSSTSSPPSPSSFGIQGAACRARHGSTDAAHGQRVLVIGHVATRWGLDHFIDGAALEDLAGQDFAWREGWEYLLG